MGSVEYWKQCLVCGEWEESDEEFFICSQECFDRMKDEEVRFWRDFSIKVAMEDPDFRHFIHQFMKKVVLKRLRKETNDAPTS